MNNNNKHEKFEQEKRLIEALIEAGSLTKDGVIKYANKLQNTRYSVIENGVLERFNIRDLDENGKYIVPDEVEIIGEGAFHGDPYNFLKVVNLNKVKTIKNKAFMSCFGLNKVEGMDNLEFIGDSAFAGCVDLFFINMMGSQITSIGASAFKYCHNLRVIHFPNCLKTIYREAFYGCDELRGVRFPKSLESIKADAFTGCTHLKTVDFSALNGCFIDNSAFCGVKGINWAKVRKENITINN